MALVVHARSFDYGDIHVVVLDSSESPYGPMMRWLKQDLAGVSPAYSRLLHGGEFAPPKRRHRRARSRRSQWLIAVVHAAPYSKGSEDSDLTTAQRYVQTAMMPVLNAAGVDVVISGHSHSYERSVLVTRVFGPTSAAWNASTMLVDGGLGTGVGNVPPYRKPKGLVAYSGYVAVVAGSAGKVDAGSGLDHPVHRRFGGDGVRGLRECGSLVVDVDSAAGELKARFLSLHGDVRDEFRIVKVA